MAAIVLSASHRPQRGRHARALRRRGLIPGVLYGHRVDPTAISADERVLARVWRQAGRTHLVDLSVDGGSPRPVLIRELQVDPRTARLVHADFFAVNLREKLTADVPLVTVGEPPAVAHRYGLLLQTVSSVKVECLPGDLPAQLIVDVSGLAETDASVTLADVAIPEGVTVLHADPQEVVAKIAPLRVQEVEAPEEEAAAAAGEEEAAAPAGEEEGAPAGG